MKDVFNYICSNRTLQVALGIAAILILCILVFGFGRRMGELMYYLKH